MRVRNSELPSPISPVIDSRLVRAIRANPVKAVEAVAITGLGGTLAFVVGNGLLDNHWGDPVSAISPQAPSEAVGTSLPEGEILKKSNTLRSIQEYLYQQLGSDFLFDVGTFGPSGRGVVVSEKGLITRSSPIIEDSTALPQNTWLNLGTPHTWMYEARVARIRNGRMIHFGRWAISLDPENPGSYRFNAIEEEKANGVHEVHIAEVVIPQPAASK